MSKVYAKLQEEEWTAMRGYNFPNAIWAAGDLVCSKEPDDQCRVKYIRADLADPISAEVESLLINVAQILDVVKTEWAESWSPFDQDQREHITRLLDAKRPPNSVLGDKSGKTGNANGVDQAA